MVKPKVVAVVPTRKGSQRIPSKNTRPFLDTNLLELKLRVLKHVPNIDNIIVNTDCEKSEEIAKSYGIDIHRRDPYYASSTITNDSHWRHIAETTEADIILLAQTTSPMVKVDSYIKAIDMLISSDIDSVNSVSIEKKFLWYEGKPLNYDIDKTPKSQELPNIVSLNYAITLIDKKTMFERGNIVGNRPRFITLNDIESTDIDDQIHFDFSEFLYEKYGFKWLQEKNLGDFHEIK